MSLFMCFVELLALYMPVVMSCWWTTCLFMSFLQLSCWITSVLYASFFLLHYELMYVCFCVFCWTTSILFDVFYVFCWTIGVLFACFVSVCFVGLLNWSMAMASPVLLLVRSYFFFIVHFLIY